MSQTKVTNIKGCESIDIHDIRNTTFIGMVVTCEIDTFEKLLF
jgi:hypothetical protein